MQKFEIIDHWGSHEIVFDSLVFAFDKKGELLWEDQGNYNSLDHDSFFPQKSKRPDGKILKWDTWTITVRCRHFRNEEILFDDIRKIRMQANENNPGNNSSKWSFFLNYFPFQECIELIRSRTTDRIEIYEPEEEQYLESRWLKLIKHKKFKKGLNKLMQNGELWTPLPKAISDKIFNDESERSVFLRQLAYGLEFDDRPAEFDLEMLRALSHHDLKNSLSASILRTKKKLSPIPSKKDLQEFLLSELIKKRNSELEVPKFKNVVEFVKFLFKYRSPLGINDQQKAWYVCLAEYGSKKSSDYLKNAAYEHFRETA